MSENWNVAYQERPYMEQTAEDGVIAFLAMIQSEGKCDVLDLGCGDGRHVVHLAREEFAAAGADFSLWGMQRTRQWLVKEGLRAELACADVRNLPWQAERFDAVFSIQVIHHQGIEAIRQTLREVKRMLRPGGYFYATLPSYPPGNWKGGQYKEIESHTFAPLDGFEKGVPHYFFTQQTLAEAMSEFEILEIKKESASHLSTLVHKHG